MPKYNYELSVIIVSWNVKDYLLLCVASVVKWFSDISYELILVDNASTDGTIEAIESKFKICSLKIIKNSLNVGFAKANRQAVDMAEGRSILFLNPDTVILDGGIVKLLSTLWSKENVGMVGCRVLNSDFTTQKTCARHSPTLVRTFFYFILMSDYLRILDGKGQYYNDSEYRKGMDVDCISGCFMLVKSVLVERYGAFDETYYMYAEDIELCNRLGRNGYRVLYSPEMNIMHYGGMSSFQRENNYYGYVQKYESDCRCFKQFHGETKAKILKIFILAGSFLRVFALYLKRMNSHSQCTSDMDFLINKHWTVIRWAVRGKGAF
jgi:hypothetical protein